MVVKAYQYLSDSLHATFPDFDSKTGTVKGITVVLLSTLWDLIFPFDKNISGETISRPNCY